MLGRIRVKLKKDDGSPANPKIPNRECTCCVSWTPQQLHTITNSFSQIMPTRHSANAARGFPRHHNGIHLPPGEPTPSS